MENIVRCPLCIYSTSRNYNLKRHVLLKHEEYNNENMETLKMMDETLRHYIWGNKSESNNMDIEIRKCPHCKISLYDRANRYRHLKTCKVKMALEQNAFDLSSRNEAETSTSVTKHEQTQYLTQNIETQNQVHIQNQHNQHNEQNNINIIVFNPNEIPFLTDHIDVGKITKLIARDTKRPEDRQEPRSIISVYGRDLLERAENKCIQKKNLRANYAKVHIGRNKWKSVLDKDIYPKLACNIANTFQNFLSNCTGDIKTNIRLYVRKRLIPFLDYMADQGYCNEEERAQDILEQFNALVQEMRLITFDLTLEDKENSVVIE